MIYRIFIFLFIFLLSCPLAKAQNLPPEVLEINNSKSFLVYSTEALPVYKEPSLQSEIISSVPPKTRLYTIKNKYFAYPRMGKTLIVNDFDNCWLGEPFGIMPHKGDIIYIIEFSQPSSDVFSKCLAWYKGNLIGFSNNYIYTPNFKPVISIDAFKVGLPTNGGKEYYDALRRQAYAVYEGDINASNTRRRINADAWGFIKLDDGTTGWILFNTPAKDNDLNQ